jgi:uncharacterized protein YbaR (Trm112 family)
MFKSLETTHLKFASRFDILADLGNYLQNALDSIPTTGILANKLTKGESMMTRKRSQNLGQRLAEKERWGVTDANSGAPDANRIIRKSLDKIRILQSRYQATVTPLLHEYYVCKEAKYDAGKFYQFLISENIVGKMNEIKSMLFIVVTFLEEAGFQNWNSTLSSKQNFDEKTGYRCLSEQTLTKLTFREMIQKLSSMYDENRPDLPAQTLKSASICPDCKEPLSLFSEDSEKRCEKCGLIETLSGTLFEDSQFYNQQITCTKHKKHNPVAHSAKWIYQLQAKETKVISKEAIEILNRRAIKEYTRSGIKRSMVGMKCKQVRGWLKTAGLAKLNNHAPLIRKIITGLNGEPVCPPQLTSEEEQLILNDFKQAIDSFEKVTKTEDILRIVGKSEIRNKVYYPYFILKILMCRFKRDPRLQGLVEVCHLQSSSTLTKDDLLWKKMCEDMPEGYEYEPTDRTMLIDIC